MTPIDATILVFTITGDEKIDFFIGGQAYAAVQVLKLCERTQDAVELLPIPTDYFDGAPFDRDLLKWLAATLAAELAVVEEKLAETKDS